MYGAEGDGGNLNSARDKPADGRQREKGVPGITLGCVFGDDLHDLACLGSKGRGRTAVSPALVDISQCCQRLPQDPARPHRLSLRPGIGQRLASPLHLTLIRQRQSKLVGRLCSARAQPRTVQSRDQLLGNLRCFLVLRRR